MSGLIALVDCNNFYASCERVFQPELRGKAVVVLSNNDGCVIARSNEAKALGIAMGAPWHLNKRQFAKDGVIVRSSNYALYGDLSRRVMSILRAFAPQLEVYSIDEAFLDLDGMGTRALDGLAALRTQVLQWTGIPISIGVAPTKTLAKVANRIAKKGNGLHVLSSPGDWDKALSGMPLTDLWGISTRLEKRLQALGIRHAGELARADKQVIRKHLGVVVERLALELNGIRCHGLETAGSARKSISCTRSFGKAVTKPTDLASAVSSFTERAAEKLRSQHLAAPALLVFIHTNTFRLSEPQYSASQVVTLPVATSDTSKLIQAALRGLRSLWRPNYAYKKAGVVLVDLIPADHVQGDLFGAPDSAKSIRAMRVLDNLNARHGRGTIALASSGLAKPWGLRSAQRSAPFTTQWSGLLRVS